MATPDHSRNSTTPVNATGGRGAALWPGPGSVRRGGGPSRRGPRRRGGTGGRGACPAGRRVPRRRACLRGRRPRTKSEAGRRRTAPRGRARTMPVARCDVPVSDLPVPVPPTMTRSRRSLEEAAACGVADQRLVDRRVRDGELTGLLGPKGVRAVVIWSLIERACFSESSTAGRSPATRLAARAGASRSRRRRACGTMPTISAVSRPSWRPRPRRTFGATGVTRAHRARDLRALHHRAALLGLS
jgi:hypothetical protein